MSRLHASMDTEKVLSIITKAPSLFESPTAKLQISHEGVVITFVADEEHGTTGRVFIPKAFFNVYSFKDGPTNEIYFNTFILEHNIGSASDRFSTSLFVDCATDHQAFQLLYTRGSDLIVRDILLEPVVPLLRRAFPPSSADLTVQFPVQSIVSFLELAAASEEAVFFLVRNEHVIVVCGEILLQALVCARNEGPPKVLGLDLVDQIVLSLELNSDDLVMMGLTDLAEEPKAADMRLTSRPRALILSFEFESAIVEYAFRNEKAMVVCPLQDLL